MKENILILCTGNSCRSIMAEAMVNHMAGNQYQAYSAGSHPVGYVHPESINTLNRHGIAANGMKSQSWGAFNHIDFDWVITVCDNAANEACPIYLAKTKKMHWPTKDPAKATGTQQDIEQAFEAAFEFLKQKIEQVLL